MLSAALLIFANTLLFSLRLASGGTFPRPLSAAEERMWLERFARGDPANFTCAGQVNCPLRRDFACGEMLVRRSAAGRRVAGAKEQQLLPSLFQLHHGHTVLPLAVAAQPEGLHRAVSPEDLMHRLAQGAGSLAVDDADRI